MSWRKVDAAVRSQNPTAARSEQDGIYKASEVGRNKRSALRRKFIRLTPRNRRNTAFDLVRPTV
jgi:hypothetical protein